MRAGLAVVEEADGVMKLVCDQPEVTSETIDRMISNWNPAAYRASVASYRDGPGHPMLFAAAALAEVVGREGDRLLWEFLNRNPDDVAMLEVDEPRPIDINTIDDLRRAAGRLGYSSGTAPTA